MRYAEYTMVSVEKSRAEIERILSRWGATRFPYATGEQGAVIAFQHQDKQIRFVLPLPQAPPDKRKFTFAAVNLSEMTKAVELPVALGVQAGPVTPGDRQSGC
jgi:hypothetical protein